jgi:haloacetate dehalogenase
MTFDNFRPVEVKFDGTAIFLKLFGSGPPVLMLHGFPQTHLMWRAVAPSLATHFTVVCPDLPGYGKSGCPTGRDDHSPYSKRAMARDMVTVMEKLGFRKFSVVGHDRGGRVAYRMALDYPDKVERLAVLDIIPGEEAWQRADARFALAFWPWSLLAQPEPLPEKILVAAADAIVDDALNNWDTPATVFPADVREAYIHTLRDPARAHAICEEYRAAYTIDREHDGVDKKRDHRIQCPVLVLWSKKGALEKWYAKDGGPLAIWKAWADHVVGGAIDGGHFLWRRWRKRRRER